MSDDETPTNSPKELMTFFSTEDHPVTTAEFKAFWISLTKEERAELKAAQLD